MDAMETLVDHVGRVAFDDLPAEVVAITKSSVLDTLGVMFAGSSVKGCALLLDYIADWGGPPESTVAVVGRKVPAPLAAQANGAMARALELDDITDGFPLHPSASVIPTCLAVAEREGGRSGKEFLTAAALGHDLVIRLSESIKVSPVVSGRYNLFKIFAFTGSAGKLMGLSGEELLNAMGIAYSQMVGDGEAPAHGAMTSYIQQGTRAKSAIEAALMARKGITGTRAVLQGVRGFYNAYEPDPDLDALTSGLGTVFKGVELSLKLHSACRFTHESIDLAQSFLAEGLTADQVEAVTVRVANQAYSLVCEPLERKRKPTTLVEGQFSIPYTTAAAFVRGDVFIDEVGEEAINDPRILDLARRVTPVADPERETELVVGSAVMEVKTKSGRTLVKEARFPKGNPGNPATPEDSVAKFRKCVRYAARPFPGRQVDALIELVENLEQLDELGRLFKLLAP